MIIHGDGGCGKSGLVKDLFEDTTEYPVMAFKATDFDCSSISEFSRKFGDYIWDDFLQSFDDSPRKLCIIDSAEKALSMEYQDTLYDGIQALLSHGWKILFTIRSVYLDNFKVTVTRVGSGETETPEEGNIIKIEVNGANDISWTGSENVTVSDANEIGGRDNVIKAEGLADSNNNTVGVKLGDEFAFQAGDVLKYSVDVYSATAINPDIWNIKLV